MQMPQTSMKTVIFLSLQQKLKRLNWAKTVITGKKNNRTVLFDLRRQASPCLVVMI